MSMWRRSVRVRMSLRVRTPYRPSHGPLHDRRCRSPSAFGERVHWLGGCTHPGKVGRGHFAQGIQVHREESRVVDAVDVAQLIVELQAVVASSAKLKMSSANRSRTVDDRRSAMRWANSSARPAMNWVARRLISWTDSPETYIRISLQFRQVLLPPRRDGTDGAWASIVGPGVAPWNRAKVCVFRRCA